MSKARHVGRAGTGTRRHSEPAAERERRNSYPIEVRQQLLDAICAGQPFRTMLRDLGLTAKTDEDWATVLDGPLIAMRRDDLKHGTYAAYLAGCVCRECRDHQRKRMARNR